MSFNSPDATDLNNATLFPKGGRARTSLQSPPTLWTIFNQQLLVDQMRSLIIVEGMMRLKPTLKVQIHLNGKFRDSNKDGVSFKMEPLATLDLEACTS